MMRYILVLLFSCLFSNLMAQQPLQVSVMLMPPYPNYVDEMINMGDEAIITVQNTDFQNGYEFKLGLSIDGNNGVSMHTRADALPSQPIDIGPGETLILSGTELSVIYNNYSENDIEYSGITIEQIINDQSLPDGVYNICIRAYGYFTNEPLSHGSPAGCAVPFSVLSVDPPIITYPLNQQTMIPIEPQLLNINWIPAGIALADLRYRLEMVEINEAMINPHDAFLTPDFLFFQEEDIIANTFLYGPEHPALTLGNQYAVRVRAYREEGLLNINNQGYSDIVVFTYGETDGDSMDTMFTQTFDPDALAEQFLECGANCNVLVPVNYTAGTVQVNDVLQIGHFQMQVTEVSGSDTYSGKGTVKPTSYFPVGIKVEFSDIQVNENKRVMAGTAVAEKQQGSWIESTWANTSVGQSHVSMNNLQEAWQELTDPQYYLDNLATLYGELGTGLPITIGENNHQLQVAEMVFEPRLATFSLAYFEKINDDLHGERYLAFMGRNLCLTPGGPSLGADEAVLELIQDVRYTLNNKTSITFEASSEGNEGTKLLFDCNGLVGIQAKGVARFDPSVLVPVNSLGEQVADTLTAPFFANFTDWDNWLAYIDFTNEIHSAEYFRYPQLQNYDFRLQHAVIDHSLERNAPEMNFPEFYTGTSSDEWQGVYIKEFSLLLPRYIESRDGENKRTRVSGHDLLVDASGFTGKLEGENVLLPKDGSLGTWNFSIENILVEINQNQLHNAEMAGSLKIPVIEDPLTYFADIEYTPSTGTSHTYMFETTGEYKVPIWFAEATFAPNSGVSIHVNNNVPTIVATLHGEMSFENVLGDIDKNNLTDIEFSDLKIQNRRTDNAGYISIGDIGTGLTGADLAVAGFAATLDQLDWNENDLNDAALVMGLGLALAGETGNIGGSTVLRLKSKIEEYVDSVAFIYDGTAISGIGITAELGAVNISGTIEYFKDDPKFGSGFDGNVHLDFLEKITVDGNILFGNKKDENNNSFCYFYTYGLVMLTGSPIPLATPVDIYGFGGGAYFNMTVDTENIDDPSQLGGTTVDAREVFLPNKGTAGLQASVVLGLTPSTHTFNAEATLTAEVNVGSTWGISQIIVSGAGYIMQKIDEIHKDEAMVTANVLMSYDFGAHILSMNAGVEARVPKDEPLLTAQGTIEIYRSPNLWYLKAGVPQNPIEANLEVGTISAGASAYFMTGQNLPAPVLPPEVLAFFDISSTSMQDNLGNDLGIGFMAGVHFDLEFGMYSEQWESGLLINVYAGADIALMHWYAALCNGSPDFGINKWYAMGQAYIIGEGSLEALGITVAGLGIGVMVEGAFPNPFGLRGKILVRATILGTKHRMSFNFNPGTMCTMEPMDVEDLIAGGEYHRPDLELETLDMIGEITPRNASTGNSTLVRPSIEWLVEDGDTREYTYGNGFGDIVQKEYKFQTSKWWKMENEYGGWDHVNFTTQTTQNDEDSYVATLNPVNSQGHDIILPGFKRYMISAKAEILEKVGNNWEPTVYITGSRQGQPIAQTKDHVFYTTTNLTEISPMHVDYTFPYERQRFFPYEHLENGKMKFNVDHTAKFQDFESCGFTIYADFEPLEGGEKQRVEVDWQYLLNMYFEMPNLNPSTIYKATIVAEREITPTALAEETTEHCKIQNPDVQSIFQQYTGTNLDWPEIPNPNLNNINQNYPGLNTDLLTQVDGITDNTESEPTITQGKELYTIYFRTSMYATVHDKLEATKVVGTEEDHMSLYNFSQSYQPITFKRYNIKLKNGEGFDRYDVRGHDYTEQAGMTNPYFQARGAHEYNFEQLTGNAYHWYQYAFNAIYNVSTCGGSSGGAYNTPGGPGNTGFEGGMALGQMLRGTLDALPDIVMLPVMTDPTNASGLKHVKPLLNDYELGLAEPLVYTGGITTPGLQGPFTFAGSGEGSTPPPGSGGSAPDFNAWGISGTGSGMSGGQSVSNQLITPGLNNPLGGGNLILDPSLGGGDGHHLELVMSWDRNAYDARRGAIQLYDENVLWQDCITLPPDISSPYQHMPSGTYRIELMSSQSLPENHSPATQTKYFNLNLD